MPGSRSMCTWSCCACFASNVQSGILPVCEGLCRRCRKPTATLVLLSVFEHWSTIGCVDAGDASRNRTVGLRIGKGEKLEDIIKSTNTVAEGVLTSRCQSSSSTLTPTTNMLSTFPSEHPALRVTLFA